MTAEHDPSHEQLERFADALEQQFGPCLSGRAELLDWLSSRVQRSGLLNAPVQAVISMITTEYMLWQCEALGLDIDDC
jgi:hypothetical protein